MPEMAQVQALQPYDVRLCPVLQGKRVIHVLCRDRQQRSVFMHTMPSDRVSDLPSSQAQPRVYDTQDNRVAAWQHKGWVFSLVSRAPEEELLSMVDTAKISAPNNSAWSISLCLLCRCPPPIHANRFHRDFRTEVH